MLGIYKAFKEIVQEQPGEERRDITIRDTNYGLIEIEFTIWGEEFPIGEYEIRVYEDETGENIRRYLTSWNDELEAEIDDEDL